MNEPDPFSQFGTEKKSHQQDRDYHSLLNTKEMSDVAFIVEGNRFYAHKSILCSRSKYFEKLLRNTFSEFNGLELEIEIRDSPLVFSRILEFIYTGSVGDLKSLDEFSLLGLLSGSVLYELETLQGFLEKHIGDNLLTISNVCTVWRIALDTGSTYLSQRCEEFFRKYSSKISELPDFSEQMWEPLDFDNYFNDANLDSEFQSFLKEDSDTKDKTEAVPQNLVSQSINQQYPLYNQPKKQGQQQQPFQQNIQMEQKRPLNNNWMQFSTQNSIPLQQNIPSPPQNINQQNLSPPMINQQNLSPPMINPQLGQQNLSKNQQDESKSTIPPSYKVLAAKQKRLPMLQGPIWTKALEKMNTILDVARDMVNADLSTLFLHDPITNELYSHVAHPEPVDIAIPANIGICGACFTTNKCINSPSAYMDTRFYSGIDRQTGAPTLAILAVPVPSSFDGKTLGVIEFLNKKRTTEFSSDDESECKIAAKMIGKIVEKATLDVKSDIEKKGLKRIHMFQTDNTSSVEEVKPKRQKTKRRRENIPVFHFKQVN
eukprot:TRINITY_DN5653_c0_g1_i2.p1 TRINITY_DN5653_c0_g1~~TRINITY_DN5653_c0_g1_i2.p1  ORF type:complete len:543 (+),score=133.70 TRINITY_DN5653_c0_g1_i2:122-1750(+)